jgi:hypothetical protein
MMVGAIMVGPSIKLPGYTIRRWMSDLLRITALLDP